MTNPFETAIDNLLADIEDIRDHAFICQNDSQIVARDLKEIAECESAIRVLEAAGKVDKKDAERCLFEGHVDAWEEIGKLLSALPDKEQHET